MKTLTRVVLVISDDDVECPWVPGHFKGMFVKAGYSAAEYHVRVESIEKLEPPTRKSMIEDLINECLDTDAGRARRTGLKQALEILEDFGK